MTRPIYKTIGNQLLKWRSINTAPKTGEVRLLACPDGQILIGFWGWGGVTAKGQNCWRDEGELKP